MSEPGRELLLKLLRQVERGGRDTLPVTPRYAAGYFADHSLAARESIHALLQNAEQAGAITLEWGRAAAAQDLSRLRVQDIDRLAKWLGVERAAAQAAAIGQALQPLLADAPDWLQSAADQVMAQWRLGKPALRISSQQPFEAVALFRIALAVSQDRQAGLDLRRFSVQLLGDSKAIERRAARVATLLRYNPDWQQFEDNGELFRALGLEKFPPPLLLRGPLQLSYAGTQWDISPLRPFVGLTPDRVDALQPTRPVAYLLSIENLASFQRHVREIDDDGIVIYTAGFPAPGLMTMLAALDAVLPADCPVHHWGDRDLGGLRIFAKLAQAYRQRPLRAHLMDEANPDRSAFNDTDQRWLEHYRQQPGVAAALAGRWLAAGQGPMEQEVTDPAPPAAGR